VIESRDDPPGPPKPSAFVVGFLGCLACIGSVTVGAVIGGLIGTGGISPSAMEGEGAGLGVLAWLFTVGMGGVVGAIVGLICGVSILAACYIHYRKGR
jgi:hypothetical protein